MSVSRRKFLLIACSLPAIPFISTPLQAAFPVLSASSPLARKNAYQDNVLQVKHPYYKQGQTCSNCQHFRKLDFGCAQLPANSVSPNGWCKLWRDK